MTLPNSARCVLATLVLTVPFALSAQATTTVAPAIPEIETTPVLSSGDAADDPAIWVHPTDPALSLVIGNDKGGPAKTGALESYDLDGQLVQRIASPSGFFGNVDVRGDYVAVAKNGIRIYRMDPTTRLMSPATDTTGGNIASSGEGLCLYDPGAPGVADGFSVVLITRPGLVRQYELFDADLDGDLTGTLVRKFTVGSESEGCVADDANGALFISQEDVAVWRYGADPSSGDARVQVAAVGADLPADAEGLALTDRHVIVSAQRVGRPTQNFLNVYDRTPPFGFVASVRVVDGITADDCDQTDGIAAYQGYLNATFPNGLFVCQDGRNAGPGSSGAQNFKYTPLERIVPIATPSKPVPAAQD